MVRDGGRRGELAGDCVSLWEIAPRHVERGVTERVIHQAVDGGALTQQHLHDGHAPAVGGEVEGCDAVGPGRVDGRVVLQ